jgi:hypothetical protein
LSNKIRSPLKPLPIPSPDGVFSRSRDNCNLVPTKETHFSGTLPTKETPTDAEGTPLDFKEARLAILNWVRLGSKYTPDQIFETVLTYCSSGSLRKASEASGIPKETIYNWKNSCDWWPLVEAVCRKRLDNQLDARLTNIIEEATTEILDRVQNGDWYVAKDGSLKRKPLVSMDLARIFGIHFDKRILSRGSPTAPKKELLEDRLDKIAKKMEDFSSPLTIDLGDE